MIGVLIKGRNLGTETGVEEVSVKKQGEDSRLHAEERGLEQLLPSRPPGRTNLAKTLIWDSGLQNREMIHFCCFIPPAGGAWFYSSFSKLAQKETIPSALWGFLFGDFESPKRDRPSTSLSRPELLGGSLFLHALL